MRASTQAEDVTPAGFDAAVKRREDDHLNRWPLAQEVYGIATTGPPDWSVRIGIYGEWGTGKTSVLQFVAEMARADKHVVIPFNPWEHSTKEALWRAFVLAVYSQPAFANAKGARFAQLKDWAGKLEKAAKTVSTGVSVFHDKGGKAVGAGLELVKKFFSFSEKDLKALRASLGTKRIIVLIDDLDRTAPELVPEILFALKELMDLPGFSFLCAFDPVVVGEVLGRYHPGFGDGLKFLEKIIDYPRWLPPAPTAGLVNLALADAAKYCPYVPESALREVVPLLPANPRAVRQFTRLLALLAPQINRHYADELRWPVILAANALKIRYPLLGHDLLTDDAFLGKLQEKSFGAEFRDEEKPDKKDILSDHVKRTAAALNVPLSETQQKEIVGMLDRIFSPANVLLWAGEPKISYQLNIAEAPHAVTGKEYDLFLRHWESARTRQAAETWIDDHARQVNRPPSDVLREVFQATVQRYAETLRSGDTVLTQPERTPIVASAKSLVTLLECLTFDLGRLNEPDKPLGADELDLLFQTFASILASISPVHAQFQPRNEQLLLKLVQSWGPDLSPLLNLLQVYGHFPGRHFDREGTQAIHKKLCAAFLPNLAAYIIKGLREPGFATSLFAQERDTYSIRGTLFDLQSPLWTTQRDAMLTALKEAQSNRTVQENAYELIHLFDFKLHDESTAAETQAIKTLLADQEVLNAIWAAATAAPLNLPATGRLRRFVAAMKASEHPVPLPAWWDENIKAIRALAPQQLPETETAPEPPPQGQAAPPGLNNRP